MHTRFWIETNWGESLENVTQKEITALLQQISKIEKINAVFWIGDYEGLHILEFHKDLNLHYIHGENLDQRISKVADGIDQCSKIIKMFLEADFILFKNRFKHELDKISH